MPEFVRPNLLWLSLLLLPYFLYHYFIIRNRKVRIPFSRIKMIKSVAKKNSLLRFLPIILNSFIILSIIVALAHPRLSFKKKSVKGKGIDIIFAIDVSGSMRAIDFKPKNRLEAAKKIAKNFVKKRKNDRISIIQFAEHSYTKTPLTLDYNMILSTIDNLKIPDDANGTAIGLGMAASVARLKDSKAKSKIIILLTDGKNNSGSAHPLNVAEMAKTLGVKIYTIGVGKKGYAQMPYESRNPFTGKITTVYKKVKVDVDMETLDEIAKICGTKKARRAHNTRELEAILEQINRYEKTKYEIKNYFIYKELFHYFIYLAIILLIIKLLFKTILKKKLP